MPEPVLEITDLRKQYGAITAVDGVSLTVEAGEVFGLLGPNGAGKTTLLSIAAGLLRSDGGSVRIFGKPFTRDSRELRHLVGMGTQDLSIYPDLTGRENLRFFGKLYGLLGKDLESRVDGVLEAVGLTDRANDLAGTYSGGMRRRLNLAAAVVHGPKLLILDEPTTGVDPQSRNHIFEQVKSLNAAGLTVIYTSHYMEEVQTLCRRIAIMDNGKFLACDTLPNLLKRLDTSIRVTVASAPPGLAERLAAIPGVKQVREDPTPRPPPPRGEGVNARDASRATTALPGSEGFDSPSPEEGVAGGTPGSPSQTGGGRGVGSSFDLVVDEIGPVLARVASECAASGAELTAVTTTEPTLERVFLHLTGRGLRD
jgi:ABC-2 type transport system ATP-binding protein